MTLIIKNNRGWFVLCCTVFALLVVVVVGSALAQTVAAPQSSLAEHADILEKIALYYLAGTMSVTGVALAKLFSMFFGLRQRVAVIEQHCVDFSGNELRDAHRIYRGPERRITGRRTHSKVDVVTYSDGTEEIESYPDSD